MWTLFHIPWGWHEKQHDWNKTRAYELHKMKKKVKRLWEREDHPQWRMILEVFAQREAPASNLADKKKREALEVSHPGFSTFLDPCTYVGMSTCLWHMQNDLPHTTGPAMTAVTEYTPRLNIREEMLLYLFCMSGS